MAYPSKLSAPVHETIVQLVKSGISLDYAAERAQVSREAIRLWMRKGERDLDDGKPNTKHAKLVKDLREARASVMALMEGTIVHAAIRRQDWKAAVTYMERQEPAKWGRKDMLRVEVDNALQEVLSSVRPLMPPEHFQSLVRAIATINNIELPDETLALTAG